MKKFFVLTVLLLMISANCFAMTFQPPAVIGTVSTAGSDNAIIIDGTTNINATAGGEQNAYIKGIAIFDGSLYLHFNGELVNRRMQQKLSSAQMIKLYNEVSFFGGSDAKNSVPFYVFEGLTKIYRINNDAGLEIYLLSLETGGGGLMEVIGKQGDKWVKFFDTRDGKKTYGIGNNFYLKDLRVSGDEIIFRYTSTPNNISRELHYKWDSSAQWFSVRSV